MDPLSGTQCQSATCIGATAQRVLVDSSSGRVLAVVRGAVYLRSDSGELIWLNSESAPMHGRGLCLSGGLPRPAAGSAYVVAGDRLAIDGETITVEWGRAVLWSPEAPRRQAGQSLEDIGHLLQTGRPAYAGLGEPRGFGALLSLPQPVGGHPTDKDPATFQALLTGLPAARRMAEACTARDLGEILDAADDLVGLGEGLTPSGDDFVGGMLFAIVNLQALYAPFPACSPSDFRPFLGRARQSTNIISFTLLSDHTAGQASEPEHRFLSALLAGCPTEVVRHTASDVVRIGHTTGWDLLAGIWVAVANMAHGARFPSEVSASGVALAEDHGRHGSQ
ncbi:MAG: DUF2877 domain-containing protein, partial [Anaerolineales bacterium]|nr:DUF2877 domain-containing protein [Anaerolineales bacterium]